MEEPQMSQDTKWPEFFTWCSLCGDGQQEAKRDRVEGDEAVYESRCVECWDGFPVRVPTGTPDSERAAFFKEMGDRWRLIDNG